MSRIDAIKLLEKDSEEFLKSEMGQRILNQECTCDDNDIIEVLCTLEEPLTETVTKMRKIR